MRSFKSSTFRLMSFRNLAEIKQKFGNGNKMSPNPWPPISNRWPPATGLSTARLRRNFKNRRSADRDCLLTDFGEFQLTEILSGDCKVEIPPEACGRSALGPEAHASGGISGDTDNSSLELTAPSRSHSVPQVPILHRPWATSTNPPSHQSPIRPRGSSPYQKW